MDEFNEVSDKWLEQLREFADGETVFSMADMLTRVTLDMLLKVRTHRKPAIYVLLA